MSRKLKGWLSYDQFLKSFKLVPRIAICLLIEKNKALLLSRRTFPPEVGKWHYPGTFLLKGEMISQALNRVLKDELQLSLSDITKPQLVGVFENLKGDPRGHVIDVIYRCQIKSLKDQKNLRFFSKLPDNIGFNHKKILNELGFC